MLVSYTRSFGFVNQFDLLCFTINAKNMLRYTPCNFLSLQHSGSSFLFFFVVFSLPPAPPPPKIPPQNESFFSFFPACLLGQLRDLPSSAEFFFLAVLAMVLRLSMAYFLFLCECIAAEVAVTDGGEKMLGDRRRIWRNVPKDIML